MPKTCDPDSSTTRACLGLCCCGGAPPRRCRRPRRALALATAGRGSLRALHRAPPPPARPVVLPPPGLPCSGPSACGGGRSLGRSATACPQAARQNGASAPVAPVPLVGAHSPSWRRGRAGGHVAAPRDHPMASPNTLGPWTLHGRVLPPRPQTSDVVVFSIRGPWKSRPFPWDRFFILSRFLTVPGPGEGPRRPETSKNRP